MSPTGTRGQGDRPGSASRHAAALSGIGIRACARIAAGALPGISKPGKGLRYRRPFHGLLFDAEHEPNRTKPCRGRLQTWRWPFPPGAGVFSFPLCGGPILRGTRRAGGRRCSAQPPGVGRHLSHDALRNSVQPLETHHPHSRSGWRNPPWAHDGTHGKTQMLLLDGASPCPRKRPVILPSQASEAVTFSRLPIGSRASALPGPSRRDLRNVSAPRVDPEVRRSTWTKSAIQRVEK